jgi:predicted RNA-binding Zn-ribbon protein involved in translation (DUF1610 family)
MSNTRTSSWMCPNCSAEIGKVVNGELETTLVDSCTSGINVVYTCPECGHKKVWYTRLYLDDIIVAVLREVDRNGQFR